MRETTAHIDIVVIVEDDEPLRDALASVLKSAGFAVGKFASAEDFLSSPELEKTRCLILDVRLPGMSGIELQRRLRETGQTVPIVFITAHGDAAIREMVLSAGAVAFLTKPVRREPLLDQVRTAVAMTG